LFILNTVSLDKEKALLVKNGQDTAEIDKRLADNDIKIFENAEKQKALIISQANKKSIDDYKTVREKNLLDLKDSLSTRLKLEEAAYKKAISSTTLTEEQKTEIEREHSAARKEILRQEQEARKADAGAAVSLLNNVASALGKHTALGKDAAIAGATISAISSAVKAYDAMAGIPIVGPALGAVAAAAALVAGMENVKKIEATKVPGGGGSSSSSSGSSTLSAIGGGVSTNISAPSIGQAAPQTTNISNQSVNQLSANRTQSPIRAVVVESEVTASQQRVAGYKSASSI